MRLNFITPKWAWPTGGLDKLLSAAVAKDYDTGLGAAKAWFATTDIDHASHAEHRLLAAVSHRYGSDLSDLAEYPRLQGMQRMLWAKALIASKEVKPAIKMVVDAGIDVMLLKGAARTAMDESAFKTRISYDVDLLVRPEDFEPAFQMLTSAGWTPSSGESNLCIARGLPGRRSVNMFSGHFGDIDLHQFGYGSDGAVSGLEQCIWDTAPKATYFDVPVLIPCPEHAVAMAITHSGRDGHRHSDWVVDCATYTQLEGFDWSALRAAIQILGQGPIADATFGYLRDKQGLSVPARPFSDPGLAATVRGIPDLIQAKPRANHTNLSRAARWIVKQLGFDRTSDNKHRSGQIQGMLRRSTSRQNQNLDPRFEMALLDAPTGEHYAYDIEIMVPLNGHRRRLEFELNSAKTHYKRLRARNWLGLKGNGTLRFRGHLDVAGDPSAVRLVARPTRNLRSVERDTDATRYSAIPFQITRQTFTRIDRTKTSNAPQGSRYAYKREGKKMTRYRLNSPPVISETVDGEVIIINLDNGKYSSIRANSATVWLAVVAGNTAEAILAECQGASDTADANLSAFIDTLRSESLIVETEATTATSPPQAWADERLTVETFEDMTDLLGLDPVHEVDLERGWPVASN